MFALVACSEAHLDAVALGDRTYADVCARCHGQDGRGGIAIAGQAPPRDLTDPAWHASLGDGQIEAVIRTGRGTMPGFQKALSPDQIQALVGTIRRFKREGTTP